MDRSATRRTPLYDRHIALGARMIPFAGWMMPVQYRGIIEEHRAVRSHAGLFDLGHMGQVEVAGPGATALLQYITTNDVEALAPGQAQYSLLPNETGGVVDDIIVYRRHDGTGFMVCVNGSNRDKDVHWMERWREARRDLDATVRDVSDETGMMAIQGPRAQEITQRVTDIGLEHEPSFSWAEATVGGVRTMAARTGYTGEDGFEFFCPVDEAGKLWDALMAAGADDGLVPVGLGARDTLRLEARMPLYGNELAEDISPLEAGLGWAVKLEKGDFVGCERIAEMKTKGVPRRTVGFKLTERSGSPRSHYEVRRDGQTVGHVTSGAFSPTLNENIGLALIASEAAGVGQPIEIVIREKPVPAIQIKTPFYKRTK